jgi:hypothetical protein
MSVDLETRESTFVKTQKRRIKLQKAHKFNKQQDNSMTNTKRTGSKEVTNFSSSRPVSSLRANLKNEDEGGQDGDEILPIIPKF